MSTVGTGGIPGTRSQDWLGRLRHGFVVEVQVYGDRMLGQVQEIAEDNISVRIPRSAQSPALQLSTAYGTATISLESGAANVPVSMRAAGDTVRLQVIGPAEVIQRRMHERFRISVPVTLAWRMGQGGAGAWERAVTRTEDVSAGGIRVVAARAVWPSGGMSVLVSLELPSGIVQAEAVTVGKTADYGLRLRFTRMAPDAAAAIAALGSRPGLAP